MLSLAQLHGWCAAEPYAYTAQTGGYGFVMDDDPNIATISIVGSGANVEVEVNLPTIPDGTQLSARGYTGSCFGASTECELPPPPPPPILLVVWWGGAGLQ